MADDVELKIEVQDVATLQIEPQEIPNLDIEPQYGRDATINGVNALEIITEDGISSEMVGSTFIISGQQLQQEDARLEQLIESSSEQQASDKEELERKIALEESLRTSADEELQENIDAEAVLRSNADIQLQQNINSEEQARESSDNALSGRIDNEESARINADNTLQQNITNEETARTQADETLQSNIDSEAETRANADTALGGRIDTEATARANKDSELEQAIRDEQTRAEIAESNLNTAIESEETARTQADSELQSQITINTNDITSIKGKIPTQASSTNQLADKDFVNSSINNVTAFYITKNAAGDPFATKAELDSTTVFYSGGEVRTLTRNDYCIVLADESKIDPETQEVPTTRYIYQNAWQYQYTVNKTSLTAEQLKAINSGITEEKVSEYDEHIADNTIHVTQNDKNTWNAKQPAGDYATNTSLNNEVNRATQAEEDLGGLIDGLETSKQDVISDLGTIRTGAGLGATAVQPATLNNYVPTSRTVNNKALSSNITLSASDIGAVPTTRTVNGKALSSNISLNADDVDALPDTTTISDLVSESQLNAINSTITSTKVSSYDTHIGNTTIHVTGNDKTVWNGKQNAITSSNKLSADLISDGTTNKVVTQTEKNTWNGKQNAISDLDDIRAGAELGATAVQPNALDGYVPTSRTINSKALTANVSLNASDVGALSTSTKYGASLSYSNNSLQLKDQSGGNLGSPVTIKTTGTLNDLTDVVISGQTSGQFLSYNGTKWVNTTFSGLQNSATGINSLTILGNPSLTQHTINIGYNSSVSSYNGVVIGTFSEVGSNGGIAIGASSIVDESSDYAISIGNVSYAGAFGAIQIGQGSNTEAGTLCIGLVTSATESNNYKLLGSDGKIPTERLADNGSTGQVLKKTSSGMEWGTAGVSVSYDSTNERLIFG